MEHYVFNEIDRLVNTDLGMRKNRCLYRTTRSSSPLCLEAAETFERIAKENGTVLITSGFPIIPEEKPETDGPPGAVLTANAAKELGANSILLAEEISSKVHRDLAEKIGIGGLEIIEIPTDAMKSDEVCSSILNDRDPDLLVSIEKPGAGKNGHYHNMNGEDVS